MVILTEHTDVDYEAIMESSILIIDTRNAMHGIKTKAKQVLKA